MNLSATAILIIAPIFFTFLQAASKASTTIFGPFSGPDHSYRVIIHIDGDEKAKTDNVREFQVSSSDGKLLWHKTLSAPHADGRYVATAYEITGLSGRGFGIEYAELRPGRIPSGHLVLFTTKDDRLQPFPKTISFEGKLEHFPDIGPQKRELVGDRAIYQLWTGYFFVLGRDIIRFDTGRVTTTCDEQCPMPVIPESSTVSTDNIIYVSSNLGGKQLPLDVKRGNSVHLLGAMVPSISGLTSETQSPSDLPALHFQYQGKEYWTNAPQSFSALGLNFKPRADQK